MTFLYFAYGSNMLVSRLTARCPTAKIIGKAVAPRHGLEFSKRSMDSSGKATLVNGQSGDTPGVLFEIETAERELLYKAEGVGSGYNRHHEFQVQLGSSNEFVAAATYLASERRAHLKPYDWYLALVIAGAHQHELDARHIQRLRQTDYLIDADAARKGRIDALAALSARQVSSSSSDMRANSPGSPISWRLTSIPMILAASVRHFTAVGPSGLVCSPVDTPLFLIGRPCNEISVRYFSR